MSKEEEIQELIQEAWNEGDSNSKDKFGDFLKRASAKICQLESQPNEGLRKEIENLCSSHNEAIMETLNIDDQKFFALPYYKRECYVRLTKVLPLQILAKVSELKE